MNICNGLSSHINHIDYWNTVVRNVFQARSRDFVTGVHSSKNSRSQPHTARGSVLGERCKLPQRGLGRSPSQQRLWCILDKNGSN